CFGRGFQSPNPRSSFTLGQAHLHWTGPQTIQLERHMAYVARPLELDAHRDALANLWRENMSDARITDVVSERMRWLYERNPAGPARTWLGVVVGSEQIVGCGSFFPRTMFVGGSAVPSGVLSDFAVDRAHRVAGAAITIQRALVKASPPAGITVL